MIHKKKCFTKTLTEKCYNKTNKICIPANQLSEFGDNQIEKWDESIILFIFFCPAFFMTNLSGITNLKVLHIKWKTFQGWMRFMCLAHFDISPPSFSFSTKLLCITWHNCQFKLDMTPTILMRKLNYSMP